MWWSRIIEWFSSQKERKQILQEFNKNANEAFVNGVVPVYLKATIPWEQRIQTSILQFLFSWIPNKNTFRQISY